MAKRSKYYSKKLKSAYRPYSIWVAKNNKHDFCQILGWDTKKELLQVGVVYFDFMSNRFLDRIPTQSSASISLTSFTRINFIESQFLETYKPISKWQKRLMKKGKY